MLLLLATEMVSKLRYCLSSCYLRKLSQQGHKTKVLVQSEGTKKQAGFGEAKSSLSLEP